MNPFAFIEKHFDKIVSAMQFKRHSVNYIPTEVKLNGRPVICGEGSLYLGKSVKINSGLRFNSIGGQTKTIFNIAKGTFIRIGNNVGISNSALVAKGPGITVEDDVMIGGSCKIYDSDFHSTNFEERMADTGTKTGSVIIHRGAFVGAHSIRTCIQQ